MARKKIIRKGKGTPQKHSEFLVRQDTGAVEHGTTTQLDTDEIAAEIAKRIDAKEQIPRDGVITRDNAPLTDIGSARIYEANSQGGFTTLGGSPAGDFFEPEGTMQANRLDAVGKLINAAVSGDPSDQELGDAIFAATSGTSDNTAPDDHEFAAKVHRAFEDLEGEQRTDAVLENIDSGADDTEAMNDSDLNKTIARIAIAHEEERVNPLTLVEKARRKKTTDESVREALLNRNPEDDAPVEFDVLSTGDINALRVKDELPFELDVTPDIDGEFNPFDGNLDVGDVGDKAIKPKGWGSDSSSENLDSEGDINIGTLEGYAVKDSKLLAEMAKEQEVGDFPLPDLTDDIDPLEESVQADLDAVGSDDGEDDFDLGSLESGEGGVSAWEEDPFASGEKERLESGEGLGEVADGDDMEKVKSGTQEPSVAAGEEKVAEEDAYEIGEEPDASGTNQDLEGFVLESPPKAEAIVNGEESFAREREASSVDDDEDERNISTQIVRPQKLIAKAGKGIDNIYTAVRYGTPGWVKWTLGVGIVAAGTVYAVKEGVGLIEENRPYVGEEEQLAKTGNEGSKDYKAVAKADSGSRKTGVALDGGAMDQGIRGAVLEDSDAKVDRQIDAVVQGIIDEDAQVDDASVNEDDPDVLDAKEVAKRKPKEVSEEELAKNMEKASVKTAGGDIREEHGDGKKDYGIDDKVNTIAPIIVTAKALDFETFKGSDLFENPASPESLYGVDSEGVAHKYNPDGSEVRLSKKGQSEVKKYVAAKTPVEESEAPSAAVAESKIGVSGLARILEGFEIPDVTPDEDKPTSRVYQDAKTYVFTKGQSAWTKSIEMFGTADYVKTIEMLVSEQRGTPKRSIILKGKEIETRIIDGKSYIVKKLIKGDTVWKSAKVIARDTNTPIVNVYENLIADNSHIADLSKVDVGEEVYIRMDHYSKK